MAVVSGSGFQFSVNSTGGVWSWSVVSRSIPGAGVFYEIHDFRTPWGPLAQAAIPIPSDVIISIADTVSEVQQQLSPQLSLAPPSQSSFTVVITEGDPNQLVAEVPVVNSGAFGSVMVVSATPSVPWLKPDPGVIQGLGKNDVAAFGFTLLTGSLLASGSPYLGVVNLQDNRNPPGVVPLAFQVSVLPRPVIGVSPSSVQFLWYQSTSSATGPFSVSVANTGPAGSVLNWTAAKLQNTSPWLSLSATSGGPLASGSSQSVSLSVFTPGVPALPGTYSDSVRFSSPNAQNGYVDVAVSLVVTP